MSGPKFKKDNPLLFGQSKSKEGCVVSNRSMVNETTEKAITKFSDVRQVIDKRKGEPLRDTRTATDKIIVQDIVPGLGFGNLLFNGDGEEACWISTHGTRNYTTTAPPSFWDVSGVLEFVDGCGFGYTGRNAIAVETTGITGVKPSLYQYLGRYVSDVCDEGALGSYKSFLYLPAYTLKFRLLRIKGEWSACILARDSTDETGAISILVKSQIKISPSSMVPGEMVSALAPQTARGTATILSTTWERTSFADPLLGVAFYPEGTIASGSHHLYIDSVQLTPAAYPVNFDVSLLWGDRFFLWFRKEDGGAFFDETVTFDNCHGTTDGYLLPYNFFVDYIHMRVVGADTAGTYTVTGYKGGNIITDGADTLQATKTFVGTEVDKLYWDHEHFAPDNIGGAGRSGCRGLGIHADVDNLVLNASLTIGDNIELAADNIYAVLSGFFIR